MIALVLAMVRVRRGQAATLALLAMFAVAAAVAAAAYLDAVDRAVAVGQVATAMPAERRIVITSAVDDNGGDVAAVSTAGFADVGTALIAMPGFHQVYAGEYATVGIEPDPRYRSRLTYRQDVCAHLEMVSGRCLSGEGETVIGERTGARLGLRAGDAITLQFATFSKNPTNPIFIASGEPKQFTVAGTYRVPRPDEQYWGTHGYFTPDPGERSGEPLFTSSATMDEMDHGPVTVSIDAAAGDGTLDVDRLATVREELAQLKRRTASLGSGIVIATELPNLLDRIDAGRASARLIVPVAAVPLILSACFVIFLAVGYGTDGRRPELAVVALRGSRWWTRWWLATGESLVPIGAGALAGCVGGQLLVTAMVAWRFPDAGVAPFGFGTLAYAPIIAAIAIGAAVLAQRRQLVSPVADLLHRVPSGGGGWRPLIVEAAVALLAVVALVLLVLSGGVLTGIGLFAPALLMLTLALAAGRVLLPLVSRYARAALGRGRLSVMLAGFQLTRRPGAQRLFAVLVAAVAELGVAVAALDVGAQGRRVEAAVGTGADRVLAVSPVSRGHLLHAVRTVDPAGDLAVAVAELPTLRGDLPALAVDTTRLAAVANWPENRGAPAPAEVARLLRPGAPPVVVLPGRDLTLDVTTSGIAPDKPLEMNISVASITGLGAANVRYGRLQDGPYTYTQRVPVCRDGCRLDGIQIITATEGTTGIDARVTVRGLRVVNPERVALPAAQVADPARWRITGFGSLSGSADGLQIVLDAPEGLARGTWVQPNDVPYPLPVAATPVAGADTITGLDSRKIPVDPAIRPADLPRLGAVGTLVDLEYADRLSVDAGPAVLPEVWLSAAAPADVVGRLNAQGLSVTRDTGAGRVHRQLDEQGPALALWFHLLAGALAVVLAAGGLILAAAVDRTRRVEDLSALRVQGVDRRTAGRAVLWTYPVLALIAAVVGVLIALIAWRVTGWALPLSSGANPALRLPQWPRPLVLGGAWLVTVAVLAGAALAVGHDLRRRI